MCEVLSIPRALAGKKYHPSHKGKVDPCEQVFLEVRLANRDSHLLEIFGMCSYPAQ